MSIEVMTAVWKRAPYEGGALLVLLALADWADDDGVGIFPTVKKLATKARLTTRAVQFNLKKLKDEGIIVLVAKANGKRGLANEWRIDIQRLNHFRPINDPAPISDQAEHKIEEELVSGPNDDQSVEDFTPGGNEEQGRKEFAPPIIQTEERNSFTRELGSATGEAERATGEVSSISPIPPYIDIHHVQPSLHTPNADVRVGARVRVVEPNKVIDPEKLPDCLVRDPVELFMRAGPWHPSSIYHDTQKAMAECAGSPLINELVAAAKRYFVAMDVKNAKRRKDDPLHVRSAAAFIRKAMWNDYPPPERLPRSKERKHVWGGHPAVPKLIERLGEGVFDQMIAPTRLKIVDHKPPIILAPTALIRDILETKHWQALEWAFGMPVPVQLDAEASVAA